VHLTGLTGAILVGFLLGLTFGCVRCCPVFLGPVLLLQWSLPELLLSYGPPWAHYLGGYQDRLLGGPLGLPGLRYTAPDGMEHKDYGGEVLG
jgi:hypothetical protein